jgi:ABC-2 type transport system permease protein
MFNTRLLSIIRKEFIQISRDPRTFVMVIVIPIMQLFLLGYAANNDVRNVSLAVFDQDRSPAARDLLAAYRAADYFAIAYDVNSEDELRQLIDSGKARAGLIIPPDYAEQLQKGQTAHVAFLLDGSDPTVASTALAAAKLIGQAHATEMMTERLSKRGAAIANNLPVEVHTQVWYNPDLVNAYFMVPGVIGMILYAITSILTANAIVRERERGTIEQLIVTPIRSWELLVGKLLPYTLLALFNAAEVLFIGSWWFHVPIRSSILLVMGVSALFLVSSLGIGLLASTIANTQQEAMMTVWMTLLPGIFLSGFFFPIAAMPPVLQWVSYLMPLRYFLSIIRQLLLKGGGFAEIQNDVIALVIFGIGIMTLASLRFRKRLD